MSPCKIDLIDTEAALQHSFDIYISSWIVSELVLYISPVIHWFKALNLNNTLLLLSKPRQYKYLLRYLTSYSTNFSYRISLTSTMSQPLISHLHIFLVLMMQSEIKLSWKIFVFGFWRCVGFKCCIREFLGPVYKL